METTKTFNQNLERLNGKGFDLNKSLNILKRLNKHIEICINHEQNFAETLFYVEQDFSFNDMEVILVDAILSEKKYEDYFIDKM